MTSIAIDHDSTLASVSDVAFDLMLGPDHGYSYDNIESWEWGLETFGTARYLSGLWHAWTLRPLEVPTFERGIANTVSVLREHAQVDIVSAFPDHMGIKDGKIEWLEHHDIEYDNFVRVPPRSTKAALDYDYYIDDKPALPEKVNELKPTATVYLFDQPYNRDAPGNYTRVHSVFGAAQFILGEIEAKKEVPV